MARIASRLSQELRHWLKALRKRRGLAEVEEAGEEAGPGEATARAAARKAAASGRRRAEPGHQPEAEAREGAEGDDRRGGMHSEAGEGPVEPAEEAALASGSGSRSGARMSMSRSRGGRYLLTGRVPCSGMRSKPPRSATRRETGARRVGEIAEVAGAGRAGADAGGDAVDLGKLRVINAVDAEGAFLHHPCAGSISRAP